MTTVISQASRYHANFALFDAHLVRERQDDFLRRQQQLLHTNAYAAAVNASRIGACTANTSTLLHTASSAAPRPTSPDAESKSMGEGAASNSQRRRRRRRRRTLHNHRFSDRSESEAGSESDEDSDLEMDRRGRTLTRLGDESNDTSCASSSRVLSSTRGVRSDDEDRVFEDSSDDDDKDEVCREVEDFKKLLAQAQRQDCFFANMPDEAGTALTCDDEESEDDEYDSESVDDDDDDDGDDGDDLYSFPRRDSLFKYDVSDDEDYYDEDIRSEGTRGSSSSALSGTSLKSLKNRYTVTDFSVNNDPGRVVRVDRFMVSRDIVPDAVVRQ
ncbi:hypothetical protein V1515DRAFT_302004 [Lipomyces mesembrius]